MTVLAHIWLQHGIAAAKANNIKDARFYLEGALQKSSDPQVTVQAWLWLTAVSDDIAEKRWYLANILSVAPDHHLARRSLIRLRTN